MLIATHHCPSKGAGGWRTLPHPSPRVCTTKWINSHRQETGSSASQIFRETADGTRPDTPTAAPALCVRHPNVERALRAGGRHSQEEGPAAVDRKSTRVQPRLDSTHSFHSFMRGSLCGQSASLSTLHTAAPPDQPIRATEHEGYLRARIADG